MPSISSQGPDLPAVRRLEAVGFRAWPSRTVVYDGSWQVRLTPGHLSKRLNCIVPLDPSDVRDMPERIEKARVRFASGGQVVTIRETPLCPPLLIDYLRSHGWTRFETVHVMSLDLDANPLPDAIDHLPLQDAARFADACVALSASGSDTREVLLEILGLIKPATGYFLVDDVDAGPQACVLCVQDNDIAGIQSLAVAPAARRAGLGTQLVVAALRWARLRGARSAWLQVSADNRPAIGLYEKLGFSTVYHYHYWRETSA